MINTEFFIENGEITGFSLKGHSDFAEYGSDIVCSAVSSAAYMTANTITDVLCIKCGIEADEGYMYLTLGDEDVSEAQTVLQGFKLHMTELQKEYGNYIKIKFSEV